jgi:hypothetical protein
MREYFGNSKEAMIMLEELPMFLDMALHRMLEFSSQAKTSEDKSEE